MAAIARISRMRFADIRSNYTPPSQNPVWSLLALDYPAISRMIALLSIRNSYHLSGNTCNLTVDGSRNDEKAAILVFPAVSQLAYTSLRAQPTVPL